ncbi:unnamed protein product [Owenia fusiformis]|uniref:Ribosomal protein 63 n=1 Tax=Owenia fusiformis TaxID=6347 RepID=A0A8S4Q4P0_OWEFU|nr:unnamed protein product [Owenia fusiformis]
MHLTKYLQYFVRRRHIPGHLFKGKVRYWPRVTHEAKLKAVVDSLREQDNVDLLSRPYITEEQEHNYMYESGKVAERILAEKEKCKSNFFKHRSMEEHLAHLNHTKSWE